MGKKAVVLLSGGIDSSTALAFSLTEGHEVYALSFDYGQRHHRELESAKRVAESLGVTRHLMIRVDLRGIGGSALTSEMEVPKSTAGKEADILSTLPSPQSPIPVTYVPARNTIFLSFGLAWAEVLEAEDIVIGANAVDYSGYPDCRPAYLKAFEDMANLATKVSVEGKLRFRIRAPLLFLTKKEIIKKGTDLGLDYSLTWSCYDPQPERVRSEKEFRTFYVPCGKCDSCIFRAKGFSEAGIQDPLLQPRK
ncbi:MAG TPA: 7-cyano-7-deazaguanine synthase QueC [Thermodesulfovibrionales bacterium]|nr:7-cyano-7-deazaguanine synthase QueC [Thermodesulfovibrionales bacterium]